MTQAPALLTTSEAATLLRVSDETLRRWVREHKVTAATLPGGTLRFKREDIDRMLGLGATPDTATAGAA